ncbi:MAG: indolepyruvate ferredoxin oxidoreductase family protein, partial [Burkholderiaceae bacterium]|nr:indolepyruvate ferredoxin oxidoreductase family protein [Burkholderiaceae bacterium]
EFEVARLFSTPEFRAQIESRFEGAYKLHFHLGAWPFSRRNARTGALRKRELGAWVWTAMGVLQRLRGLRGTWLDPFRNSPERRFARELLAQYENDIQCILTQATASSVESAIALAGLPEKIRGYGHVREAQALATHGQRAAYRESLSRT